MIYLYIIYFIVFVTIIIGFITSNNINSNIEKLNDNVKNNIKNLFPINSVIMIHKNSIPIYSLQYGDLAQTSDSDDVFLTNDTIFLQLVKSGWFPFNANYYQSGNNIFIGYRKEKINSTIQAQPTGQAGTGGFTKEYDYGLYNINTINNINLNNVKLNSFDFFIDLSNKSITFINNKQILSTDSKANIANYVFHKTPVNISTSGGATSGGAIIGATLQQNNFEPVYFIKVF